jgi:hypothetical protein
MITMHAPKRIDDLLYQLSFTSDLATPVVFRLYQDGRRVLTFSSANQSATANVTVGANQTHFFEVLDSGARPKIAYPGVFTLHWLGVSGARSYLVEELVSAAWTERATLFSSARAFSWDTRFLEDDAVHSFRVRAYDAAGNPSTALSFTGRMVRRPDVPNVSITYNGAGTPTLTIAEAS